MMRVTVAKKHIDASVESHALAGTKARVKLADRIAPKDEAEYERQREAWRKREVDRLANEHQVFELKKDEVLAPTAREMRFTDDGRLENFSDVHIYTVRLLKLHRDCVMVTEGVKGYA